MNRGKIIALVIGFLLFIGRLPVGAANLVNNNDGTVTDPQSALMWLAQDDGIERTWSDAVAYCENLEYAGYQDWKLPQIHLLEALIDPGNSPTISPVFNVRPSYYWSASVALNNVNSAKYVNFYYGNSYAYSKDNKHYVLCVRDASELLADPLSVSFIASSRGTTSPMEIRFASLVSGGAAPYFYEWDFNDGDTSSLAGPEHVFAKPGNYKIVLTVSDIDGAVATEKRQIEVPLDGLPTVVNENGENTEIIAPSVQDIVGDKDAAEPETKAPSDDSEMAMDKDNAAAVDGEEASPEETMEQSNETASSANETGAVTASDNLSDNEEGVQKSSSLPEEQDVELSPSVSETDAIADAVEESNAALITGELVENETTGEPQLVESNAQENLPAGEAMAMDTTPEVSKEFGREKSDGVSETVTEAEDEPPVFVQSNATDYATNIDEPPASTLVVETFRHGVSPDLSQYQKGLLAYSMVNALQGDADWNKDEVLTANELKGYLSIAVQNLSAGSQQVTSSFSGDDFSMCSSGGTTYAVFVGVSLHQDQAYSAFPFAERSTDDMRQAIRNSCPNAALFTLNGEEANREGIILLLKQLQKLVSGNDQVFLYYAGLVSEELETQRTNLIVFDTDTRLENMTGLWLNDLTGFLKDLPVRNVLIFLEADTVLVP